MKAPARILTAAAAVFTGTGLCELCYAGAPERHTGALTREALQGTTYAHFADEVLAGADWIARQERQTLRVMSYDKKRLTADFLPCERAVGTILLFHGYRSCAQYDFAAYAQFLHEQGYNLLLCTQRAHGASGGSFITFGARERYDVLSWVTYLAQMLGFDHPLYLIGVSMGATSVLLASCFEFPANVRGIIADCGFTSPDAILRHVARQRFPRLPAGAALAPMRALAPVLAGYRLAGCSTLAALHAANYPVLFIHGEADTFVPCRMSEEGYLACRTEKELLRIPGARHAQSALVAPERVLPAVADFLKNHLQQQEATSCSTKY